MPKLPTVDRFRLSCEVAVSDLGPIIAQLTKMGLTNLHFELMTDVPTFAEKVKHDVNSQDFLLEWTKEHPTFKAVEAVNHFRANQRTPGAAYTALRILVEEKTLKKLGPGNYARADIKAIAAPKKEAKPAKGDPQTRYTVPNTGLIMRLIKRRNGHINLTQVKDAFEKDGRPRGSASPAIRECLDKKLIKRVGEGEYEMIEIAKNGNGAAPVVEATNG